MVEIGKLELFVSKNDFIVARYDAELVEKEDISRLYEALQKVYPNNKIMIIPDTIHLCTMTEEEFEKTISDIQDIYKNKEKNNE